MGFSVGITPDNILEGIKRIIMTKLRILFALAIASSTAAISASARAEITDKNKVVGEVVAECLQPQTMIISEPVDTHGNGTPAWSDLGLSFRIVKTTEAGLEKFVVVNEDNIPYPELPDDPVRAHQKLNAGGVEVEFDIRDSEYLKQLKSFYDTSITDRLPYGFDFSKVKSGDRIILDAKGYHDDANGIVINILKDEKNKIVGKMGTHGWGPLRCIDLN